MFQHLNDRLSFQVPCANFYEEKGQGTSTFLSARLTALFSGALYAWNTRLLSTKLAPASTILYCPLLYVCFSHCAAAQGMDKQEMVCWG